MNTSKLARELGIARSSLYYTHKRDTLDEEIKRQDRSGHSGASGVRAQADRIAPQNGAQSRLARNEEIWLEAVPAPAAAARQTRQGKAPTPYPNLLAPLVEQHRIVRPDQVWCTDFTYLSYYGKFIYLATVIDGFTREIVGVNILRYHKRFLVSGALEAALRTYGVPKIVHADQARVGI
jgi:transposase InsO family protein